MTAGAIGWPEGLVTKVPDEDDVYSHGVSQPGLRRYTGCNMASFTELAESILAQAKRLDAFTTGKGLPSSSFARHTLSDLPNELEECRKSLVDSCQDLKQLGNGPVGQFYEVLFNVS